MDVTEFTAEGVTEHEEAHAALLYRHTQNGTAVLTVAQHRETGERGLFLVGDVGDGTLQSLFRVELFDNDEQVDWVPDPALADVLAEDLVSFSFEGDEDLSEFLTWLAEAVADAPQDDA